MLLGWTSQPSGTCNYLCTTSGCIWSPGSYLSRKNIYNDLNNYPKFNEFYSDNCSVLFMFLTKIKNLILWKKIVSKVTISIFCIWFTLTKLDKGDTCGAFSIQNWLKRDQNEWVEREDTMKFMIQLEWFNREYYVWPIEFLMETAGNEQFLLAKVISKTW